MKPVNDRYFGSDDGKVGVSFHNGTTTVSGYIVKQVGSLTYVVSDGSATTRARLAQTEAAAGTLVAGAMTIPATINGSGGSVVATYEVDTATVLAGGTGYAVGNVLTGVGGTSSVPFTVTVATVSGGVITGITITERGTYTGVPGTLNVNVREVTTTGGAGSGATVNIRFRVKTVAVETPGTGYTVGQVMGYYDFGGNQPTITISSVNASGGMTGVTLTSPGDTIYRFSATITPNQASTYVKKLEGNRAYMTNGSNFSWRLPDEDSSSGSAVLSGYSAG